MTAPFTTTSEQKVAVYKIGTEMDKAGLSSDFVACAVDLALTFEGAHDLMVLWAQEDDGVQRDEIVADLQEEINSHKVNTRIEKLERRLEEWEAKESHEAMACYLNTEALKAALVEISQEDPYEDRTRACIAVAKAALEHYTKASSEELK